MTAEENQVEKQTTDLSDRIIKKAVTQSLSFSPEELTPEHYAQVTELDLSCTEIEHLQFLANLKSLKSLDLRHSSRVREIGPLAELKSLEWLNLENTQVSELAPLSRLTALNLLVLRNTQVKEIGSLAELKSLKVLDLRDTQVSELDPLFNLEIMCKINLTGSTVEESEVKKLRQKLPDCDIIFQPE